MEKNKLVWKGHTAKGEVVYVFRCSHFLGRSCLNWRVSAGDLYPVSYFETKKAAIEFCEDMIETFNRHRARKTA